MYCPANHNIIPLGLAQEIDKPKWGQTDAYDDADGGYGWFVVVGCLLAQFTSFGPALSWYVESIRDMITMYWRTCYMQI